MERSHAILRVLKLIDPQISHHLGLIWYLKLWCFDLSPKGQDVHIVLLLISYMDHSNICPSDVLESTYVDPVFFQLYQPTFNKIM